jgi:hypothetical protein
VAVVVKTVPTLSFGMPQNGEVRTPGGYTHDFASTPWCWNTIVLTPEMSAMQRIALPAWWVGRNAWFEPFLTTDKIRPEPKEPHFRELRSRLSLALAALLGRHDCGE